MRHSSAPEEFELTAAEADRRLVSRLIGERLHFPNEASREIEDMLIDRQTGAVTHWIVDMEDDSLFSAERRAIPVDRISIEEDEDLSTQIDLATLDDLQEYDPNFL